LNDLGFLKNLGFVDQFDLDPNFVDLDLKFDPLALDLNFHPFLVS